MQDRKPTKPNRKKITYEGSGKVEYAVIEYADEPVEVGTPINKANLLSDETAIKLGLSGGEPTVNAALMNIADYGLKVLPTNTDVAFGDKGYNIAGKFNMSLPVSLTTNNLDASNLTKGNSENEYLASVDGAFLAKIIYDTQDEKFKQVARTDYNLSNYPIKVIPLKNSLNEYIVGISNSDNSGYIQRYKLDGTRIVENGARTYLELKPCIMFNCIADNRVIIVTGYDSRCSMCIWDGLKYNAYWYLPSIDAGSSSKCLGSDDVITVEARTDGHFAYKLRFNESSKIFEKIGNETKIFDGGISGIQIYSEANDEATIIVGTNYHVRVKWNGNSYAVVSASGTGYGVGSGATICRAGNFNEYIILVDSKDVNYKPIYTKWNGTKFVYFLIIAPILHDIRDKDTFFYDNNNYFVCQNRTNISGSKTNVIKKIQFDPNWEELTALQDRRIGENLTAVVNRK